MHIAEVLATIRRTLDPEFHPDRALDFGCGVGRILLPLASHATHAVGIDVSRSMLEEARINCERQGVQNTQLVQLSESESGFPSLDGTFDFIHSYIVFQHIPTRRGVDLLRDLMAHLSPGGVGVVHITYARELPMYRRALNGLRVVAPIRLFLNVIRGRPLRTPIMQLNNYDLKTMFSLIRMAGCSSTFVDFTDHSGSLGAVFYFQKADNAIH